MARIDRRLHLLLFGFAIALLIVFGSIATAQVSSPCESETVVPQDKADLRPDCEALWEFYSQLDNPGKVDNWGPDTPLSDWKGVEIEGDRVVKLDLAGARIEGSISPVLAELSNLRTLNLVSNKTSSSDGLYGPIPPELARLTNLNYLNLANNQLSGPIPPELAQLTKLVWLQLAGNELSGPIPPELGKLTNLSDLYLANNQLSEPIPPELGQLTKLQDLWLTGNQLSGPIPPELGQLTKLEGLILSGNTLSGPIPPELGQLTNLEGLILSGNTLSGPIPPELGQLTELWALDLDNNQLSGPIPPELAQLTNLKRLNLEGNELSEPIPPELGQLTELLSLVLNNNQLSGPIPPELAQLTKLVWLQLAGNELSGPIPPELAQLTNLQDLWLTGNQLSGPIPPELDRLTKLEHFSVGGEPRFLPWPPCESETVVPQKRADLRADCEALWEFFSQLDDPGEVDDWGPDTPLSDWKGVEIEDDRVVGLDLYLTSIEGPTSSLLALAELSNLQRLTLGFTKTSSSDGLYGPIPPELGQLTKLAFLDLQDNTLSGPIPPELGQLTKLQNLYLADNLLSGPIPPELARLTKLQDLSLSGNQLSGPIPPELARLTDLRWLLLEGNELSGPIPPELAQLTKLERFSVSGEPLLSPWPPGLTKFRPPPEPEKLFAGRFSDDDGNPHEANIETIAALGVTQGCAPDKFCPNNNVTRAQMMAFLARALGEENNTTTTTSRFSDVPDSQWYVAYLERLADLGIVSPEADGRFRPNEPLTRVEMAVLLTKALPRVSPVTPAGTFADVPADGPFAAEIEGLLAAGITKGCSADPPLYCPDDPVTRAQMATFLARALANP